MIPATGRRITLHGVSVADFDGDRIRSFRHYWDEVELLDALGLAAARLTPGAANGRQSGKLWACGSARSMLLV